MPRLAVALVWLYQGLWCKVLGRCPGHRAIVEAVPGLAGQAGTILLAGLGAFWQQRLNTLRLRAVLRFLLHPAVLRLAHGRRFVDWVPPRFDLAIRRRLERTWANHVNRENPFAWHMLLGCEPPVGDPGARPETIPEIDFVNADATEFLAGGSPGRFDGFTLSNVLDAAPGAYRERLLAAVRHAAAPGAVLVLRSFGEPTNEKAAEYAARDRSLLWGAVEVSEIESD